MKQFTNEEQMMLAEATDRRFGHDVTQDLHKFFNEWNDYLGGLGPNPFDNRNDPPEPTISFEGLMK